MVDTKTLKSYLCTDYVPPNAERNLIESSLEDMTKSMTLLSSEMAVLQSQLAELSAQKQKMENDAAVCHDMLSPMRRLPPEIMAEIFKECVRGDYDVGVRTAHISSDSSPLLLLRICRRWRRIALSTPRLFTSISISPDKPVDPVVIVPLWLKQSKTLPLRLLIDFSIPSWKNMVSDEPSGEVKAAWGLLQKNLARCYVLDIRGFPDYRPLLHIFPSRTRTSMPNLTKFQFIMKVNQESLTAMGFAANLLNARNFFHAHTLNPGTICAPNLQICTIIYEGMRRFRFTGHVLERMLEYKRRHLRSWQHEEESSTLNWHMKMLQKHPLLERCVIKGLELLLSEANNPTLPVTIPLEHLRILEIHAEWRIGAQSEHFSRFLKALRLPKLEILRLLRTNRYLRRPDESIADALLALITSGTGDSRPLPLTHLALTNVMVPSVTLRQMLGELNQLRYLELSSIPIGDTVLEALTRKDDTRPGPTSTCCPSLAILNVSESELSLKSLARLVQSRLSSGPVPNPLPRLHEVDVTDTKGPHGVPHERRHVERMENLADVVVIKGLQRSEDVLDLRGALLPIPEEATNG